jgi:hypothetical protein
MRGTRRRRRLRGGRSDAGNADRRNCHKAWSDIIQVIYHSTSWYRIEELRFGRVLKYSFVGNSRSLRQSQEENSVSISRLSRGVREKLGGLSAIDRCIGGELRDLM